MRSRICVIVLLALLFICLLVLTPVHALPQGQPSGNGNSGLDGGTSGSSNSDGGDDSDGNPSGDEVSIQHTRAIMI